MTMKVAVKVAALKQSLQQGRARLRQYEWIETKVAVQNTGYRMLP